MLTLPVVLMALTIGVAQWARTPPDGDRPFTAGLTQGSNRALTGLPRTAARLSAVSGPGESVAVALPSVTPVPAHTLAATDVATAAPDDRAATAAPHAVAVSAKGPPVQAMPSPRRPDVLPLGAPPPVDVALLPPGGVPATPTPPGPAAAVEAAPAGEPATDRGPEIALPARPPTDSRLALDAESQCRLAPEAPRSVALRRDWAPGDGEAFGLALAAAAREQLDDFVIYNDRYTRLRYPMGDVHPMYGVCTDVVIRAYRVLGLDLQALVQQTRTGSGDPNIDHRRVDTLRKFFARFGENLPISTFAEDFRPGDIVTYWRPQNRHSRTHIAIVSDAIGPSGRPLIIHNRGWGPQQEDALFVDQITGHYRFAGLKTAASDAGLASGASARAGLPGRARLPAKPVIQTGLSVDPATPRPSP